jgi:hypothetical protein
MRRQAVQEDGAAVGAPHQLRGDVEPTEHLLAPGALGRAARVLTERPDVGLAYGRAVFLRRQEDLALLALEDTDECQHLTGEQFLAHVSKTLNNPVPTPTAVVRTSLQRRLGGYRSDLPHTGDMEMWMRIAVHADVCYLKACQGIYRWHGNNMQHHYLRSTLGDLPERRRAFDVLLAEHAARLRDAAQFDRAVNRQVAERALWTGTRAFEQGDIESFRACTDYALECFPEITSWHAWRRLQQKALIGPRVWKAIRPLVDAVRGNSTTTDIEFEKGWPGMGPWIPHAEAFRQ